MVMLFRLGKRSCESVLEVNVPAHRYLPERHIPSTSSLGFLDVVISSDTSRDDEIASYGRGAGCSRHGHHELIDLRGGPRGTTRRGGTGNQRRRGRKNDTRGCC
jgi:hypothetical protein